MTQPVNRFDGESGSSMLTDGRTITLAELPQEYVTRYGHLNIVTPSGVKMPLSQAYRDYNQTHVNVNDVPGLTDYLIKQDQPEIALDRWLELRNQHRENQKFNHQLDLAAIGTMLAPVLGIAGAEVAPFLAPGTVGGTLIGETAGGMAMGELLNKGTEMLTGRNWGDNVRHTLENTFGYNPESWSYGQGTYNFLTDMTNPGYWNGSKWLKNGINAVEDVGRYMVDDIANSWRTMRYQLAHPEYQTYGIVPDNTQFKSELDWSPESWLGERIGEGFDQFDVAALKSHIPEYYEIERIAKANGTWLKMPDGSTWIGDPRDWVMMQSRAYKTSLQDNIWWHGYIPGESPVDAKWIGHRLWGNSNRNVAESYGIPQPFAVGKNAPEIIRADAEGRSWTEVMPDGQGGWLSTDDVLKPAVKANLNGYGIVTNVVDPGTHYMNIALKNLVPKESFDDAMKRLFLGDDILLGRNVPRKAIHGANGDFDLNKYSWYKSLLPPVIASPLLFEHNGQQTLKK